MGYSKKNLNSNIMSKSIIITGAAGNLGRDVVSYFLDRGNQIFATVSPDKDPNFMQHRKLNVFQVDLLDRKNTEEFVKVVTNEGIPLDGAVLLVGGFGMGKIGETSPEEFLKMYRLNFESALHITQLLLPVFETQPEGGQFVLIGSRPALKAEEGKNMVAYAMSKSLVFKLSEYINETYSKKNITSHVIVPGTMDTPANRSAMPDADFSRWVPTERVAEIIDFVLSDTGKRLNKSVIRIYDKG